VRLTFAQNTFLGERPWSSGYGRKLMSKMSWVQMPSMDESDASSYINIEKKKNYGSQMGHTKKKQRWMYICKHKH
jgi:hypothetical protein